MVGQKERKRQYSERGRGGNREGDWNRNRGEEKSQGEKQKMEQGLQRENKIRGAENQSLKAQVQGLEENLHKIKVQDETSKREADDLLRQLQEEQRKTASLTQEISQCCFVYIQIWNSFCSQFTFVSYIIIIHI